MAECSRNRSATRAGASTRPSSSPASSTSTAWARAGGRSTGSASPASSGTRTSDTARGRTWACRCSCPTAGTRSSSTIRATRCCRWAAPTAGCGSPTPRKPGGWSGTSSLVATCVASCARWPSCSAGRRSRPAGRWDSSSRPAISTIPRSCAGSRERFARSESPATASSISRRTARPRAGTAGWGISAFSRPSGRIRPPSSTRRDGSTSRSSRTSTPCSTSSHRSLPRPRPRDTCSTRGMAGRARQLVGAPTIARASDTSTFPTRPSAPGGGRPTPSWSSSGSPAGGSTAAKVRRRRRSCTR